jgi:hypothetical protein
MIKFGICVRHLATEPTANHIKKSQNLLSVKPPKMRINDSNTKSVTQSRNPTKSQHCRSFISLNSAHNHIAALHKLKPSPLLLPQPVKKTYRPDSETNQFTKSQSRQSHTIFVSTFQKRKICPIPPHTVALLLHTLRSKRKPNQKIRNHLHKNLPSDNSSYLSGKLRNKSSNHKNPRKKTEKKEKEKQIHLQNFAVPQRERD